MWPGAPAAPGGAASGYSDGGSAAAAAAAAEYGHERGVGAYDSLMRDSGAAFIPDDAPDGAGPALGYGGYGQPAQHQPLMQQLHQHPQSQPAYAPAPQPQYAPQPAYAPAPAQQNYGYEGSYASGNGESGYAAYGGGTAGAAGGGGAGAGAYGDEYRGADGYGEQQPVGGTPAGDQSDWSERLYSGGPPKQQSSYAQMFRDGQQKGAAAPAAKRGGSGGVKAGRRASAKARHKAEWNSEFTEAGGWLDEEAAQEAAQQRAEKIKHEEAAQAKKSASARNAQARRRGPEEARAKVEAERRSKLHREETEWGKGEARYEQQRTGGRGRPKRGPFDEPEQKPQQRRQRPPLQRENSPPLPGANARGQRNRQTPRRDAPQDAQPRGGGPSEADLRAMKPSQLRDQCERAGVSKPDLDACLDADNPKSAYIKLLLDAGGSRQMPQGLVGTSSVRSSVSGRPMSRDESQNVARGLMRRRVPSAGRKPIARRSNGLSGGQGQGQGQVQGQGQGPVHGAQAMGDMPMNGSVQGLGGSRRSAAISAPARVDGYGAAADMYSALDAGAAITDAHHPLQRDIASEQRQRGSAQPQYDAPPQRAEQAKPRGRYEPSKIVADQFATDSPSRGQRQRPPRRIIGDPFAPPEEAQSQQRPQQQQQPPPAANPAETSARHDKPIWLGSKGEARQEPQYSAPPQGQYGGQGPGPSDHPPPADGRRSVSMEEEMAMYKQNPSAFDGRGAEPDPYGEEPFSANSERSRQAPTRRSQGQDRGRQDRSRQPPPAATVGVEQLPVNGGGGGGAVGGTSPPIEQPTEFAEQQVHLAPCRSAQRAFCCNFRKRRKTRRRLILTVLMLAAFADGSLMRTACPSTRLLALRRARSVSR